MSVLALTSRATPTTSSVFAAVGSGPRAPNSCWTICLPIGSCPGQNRRAVPSPTMATSGAPSRSAGVKSRPPRAECAASRSSRARRCSSRHRRHAPPSGGVTPGHGDAAALHLEAAGQRRSRCSPPARRAGRARVRRARGQTAVRSCRCSRPSTGRATRARPRADRSPDRSRRPPAAPARTGRRRRRAGC